VGTVVGVGSRVDQRSDHPGFIDVGEPFVTTVVRVGELFVIESELVENRSMKVGGLGAVVDRTVSEVVGGPVGLPSANATAGQPDAEAVGVMVTSLVALGGIAVAEFCAGCPSEFAAPLDDGRFEEATSLEIAQQCADGSVGLATDLGQSAGIARVRVPGLPGQRAP